MFVEEYLVDLRRERFAPPAIVHYLRRVARRAREDVLAVPSAVRSVWNVALVYFVAMFVASAGIALGVDRHLAVDFFLQGALAILAAFGLVTAYIGELRDTRGFRLSAVNLPIALTLFRIVAAPGIALFAIEGHLSLAFGLFLVAALTDVADGWLARRTGQITRLGVMLDPIVDIVFNLAVLAGLATAGLMPRWVFAVAALRYGLLLVGGTCIHLLAGPVRIQPTLFGRLTGVIMTGLVALLILLHAPALRLAPILAPLTETALGVLLVATVGQVVALGWFNLRTLQGRAGEKAPVVEEVRWGA